MEFERTQDILDHARDFHARLETLYRELSEQSEQKRIKLLLAYLSRHEKRLGEELARFEEQAARRVLDTWFQFVPEEDTLRRFKDVGLKPDMTVEQVVAAALRLDQYLVDLFREGARRALSSRVRDVLRNLVELEEGEQLRLKQAALDAELL